MWGDIILGIIGVVILIVIFGYALIVVGQEENGQ